MTTRTRIGARLHWWNGWLWPTWGSPSWVCPVHRPHAAATQRCKSSSQTHGDVPEEAEVRDKHVGPIAVRRPDAGPIICVPPGASSVVRSASPAPSAVHGCPVRESRKKECRRRPRCSRLPRRRRSSRPCPCPGRAIREPRANSRNLPDATAALRRRRGRGRTRGVKRRKPFPRRPGPKRRESVAWGEPPPASPSRAHETTPVLPTPPRSSSLVCGMTETTNERSALQQSLPAMAPATNSTPALIPATPDPVIELDAGRSTPSRSRPRPSQTSGARGRPTSTGHSCHFGQRSLGLGRPSVRRRDIVQPHPRVRRKGRRFQGRRDLT